MGRYRENISGFLARLTYYLGVKLRLVAIGRSSVLQTSPIFKLPDELILSILSHVSPDPRPTSHHAWFRIRHWADDCLQQRVEFLRPLSMTCKAMRLRLLPWVWERLELPPPNTWGPGERFMRKLDATASVLHANTFLAASVKFVKMDVGRGSFLLPSFVKCLKSLPNLHTLEVGWMDGLATVPLKNALKGVQFPQIKTLILFPTAYPILQHCRNAENVACVLRYQNTFPDVLLRSLASIQDSKVKRLTIPLCLWVNAPQSVAACSRLTELTVVSPHPSDAQLTKTGILLDLAGKARSAISELVAACKSLPDFGTFQIVRFPIISPPLVCWCGRGELCHSHRPSPEDWEEALEKQTEDLGEWAINCLKEPETECREGEGRKRVTLRTIEFGPGCRSVKVEEHGVYGFDNGNL